MIGGVIQTKTSHNWRLPSISELCGKTFLHIRGENTKLCGWSFVLNGIHRNAVNHGMWSEEGVIQTEASLNWRLPWILPESFINDTYVRGKKNVFEALKSIYGDVSICAVTIYQLPIAENEKDTGTNEIKFHYMSSI